MKDALKKIRGLCAPNPMPPLSKGKNGTSFTVWGLLWLPVLALCMTMAIPAQVVALPAPDSQEVIASYAAIATPVVAGDAVSMKPIAFGEVALGNGNVTVQIRVEDLDVAMDAYLGLKLLRQNPDALYLINATGGLQLFTGTLVPWRTNVSSLDEVPFGSLPLESLTGDDYSLYLLLAPASTADPLAGDYYLWNTTLPLASASSIEGVNNLALFTNPTDSSLLSFFTDTGETLTLFGGKDADGLAQTVMGIDLVDANGEAFAVELDPYALVSRVSDAHGNYISFDFTGGASADLTGGNPFILSVRQYETVSSAWLRTATPFSVASVPVEIGTSGDGIIFHTSLVSEEPITVMLDQDVAELRPWNPVGNLTINVTQCGEPASPSSLSVLLGRPGADFTKRYTAEATTIPGQYVVKLPQHNNDAREVAAVCQSVNTAIGNMCSVHSKVNPAALQVYQAGLCAQLAGAVEVANPLPGDSVAVFPLCIAAFNTANLVCGTLGFSLAQVPEATSLLGAVCNRVEPGLRSIDWALGTDTFAIQAVADFQGGLPGLAAAGENPDIVTSAKTSVSVFGPFPPLAVNKACDQPDEPDPPAPPEDCNPIAMARIISETQCSAAGGYWWPSIALCECPW